MSRLSREQKRELKRQRSAAVPGGRAGGPAQALEVHVPTSATGATVEGVPLVVTPGETVQGAVLDHLHRIARATGHPVLARVHDERIGFVVPLQVYGDGSSRYAGEPVRVGTPPPPPPPVPSALSASPPPPPARRDTGTRAPRPVGGPASERAAAPTFDPPSGPASERAADPGPEPAAYPLPEPLPEPLPGPAPRAGSRLFPEQAAAPVARPVPEAFPEPDSGPVPDQGSERDPEPDSALGQDRPPESFAEPLPELSRNQGAESGPESGRESSPESGRESGPEPVAGPVAGPVGKVAAEAVVPVWPEPVSDVAPEPESASGPLPEPTVWPEAPSTHLLRVVRRPPAADAPPGVAVAPTGEFGPAPQMPPLPEPLPPAPARATPATGVVFARNPSLAAEAMAVMEPEPEPKPTPPRGFDAVAESVLTPVVETEGAAFLAEPVTRINEAVKEGRIQEAATMAERTVAEAARSLGPDHPEVLRLGELSAYIAYLAGDALRSFHLSLDLARARRRQGDPDAAYGDVQSAATAWRAVRDPEQGMNLGRVLIEVWTGLVADGGPAADDLEQLESARTRMNRLAERARARAGESAT